MTGDPKDDSKKVKRKFTRFKPDPGTVALVDTEKLDGDFRPEITALVYEEAFKGCGLVALMTPKMCVGDKVRVRVGEVGPQVAVVRWRMSLDVGVLKLGLEYID